MKDKQNDILNLDRREAKQVATNVVMPVVYKEMLGALSKKTRIRQSEFLREAVKDLLVKYRDVFEDTPHAF